MITFDDVRPQFHPPLRHAVVAAAPPFTDRILHIVLYITVLSGCFVFVEPAPYEYLAALLAFVCLIADVSISRVVIPLLILLLIRDGSGALSLILVQFHEISGPLVLLLTDQDIIVALAISFYLGLTAVIFACIFASNTMRRLATLRSAYILSAVVAALLGTLGYFNLTYHFSPIFDNFSLNGRASGAFKEPNVFAAYIVPPLIWLIEGFIVDKVKLRNLLACIIISIGLFLAFSRASWGCSLFAVALLLYLLFITQPDRRVRKRILVFLGASVIAGLAIFAILTSIHVVDETFLERARLLQDYDVGGPGARFVLQENAVRQLLSHPLGLGPWGFMKLYGWAPHNTILGTLLHHGWVGGIAYVMLILLTLVVGFRTLLVPTPWQTFLIGSYVPFSALLIEGFIGDTDHMRHFYLLLGIIWGLTAATLRYVREQRLSSFAAFSPYPAQQGVAA